MAKIIPGRNFRVAFVKASLLGETPAVSKAARLGATPLAQRWAVECGVFWRDLFAQGGTPGCLPFALFPPFYKTIGDQLTNSFL